MKRCVVCGELFDTIGVQCTICRNGPELSIDEQKAVRNSLAMSRRRFQDFLDHRTSSRDRENVMLEVK